MSEAHGRGRTGASPARRAAFEVLRRTFEHGAWADRALPAAVRRHRLDARERSLAQRLAYGAVQRRGTADHLIVRLAGRDPDDLDAPVLAALRLGLFELLFSATPDHAAVDEAVRLAKAGSPRGSALVNAVLRRAAGERTRLLEALDDDTPGGAAVRHSHPLWLVEKWWGELGPEDARRLMAADNEAPENALRVNTLRAEVGPVLDSLAEAGTEAEAAPGPSPLDVPESVIVRGPLGEEAARRIGAGELVPQARASAAVVAVLDPRPAERILDLCAGPGIKATQIAARMENRGEIVSVERDPGRAAEMRGLCEQLGASAVRVAVGDAARDDLGAGYDRVLVDPPCSDLGTLASRPDARWRKDPGQIERVAELQARIVARGAEALRPGGILVYSTCTISKAENEDVVRRVLGAAASSLVAEPLGARHPQLASREDARFLQTRPDRDRTDGFFLARLRREEG